MTNARGAAASDAATAAPCVRSAQRGMPAPAAPRPRNAGGSAASSFTVLGLEANLIHWRHRRKHIETAINTEFAMKHRCGACRAIEK